MPVSRWILSDSKLPDFLIIGAQKAGTTSLASYLTAHPQVVAPKRKEIHFFDLNFHLDSDLDSTKDVDWYRSHFPIGRRARLKALLRGKRLLSGDATPYYLLHPLAALRAFMVVPAARIIIMLRDPVDRAYSHYHHEIRLGEESLSFEEAIAAEDSRIAGEEERILDDPLYASFSYQHFTYLKRGLYAGQIRDWLRYYPADQVLIVSSEQLFENPFAEYQRVLKFLRLPTWELPSYRAEFSGKYPPLDESTRDRLCEYFAPHNRELHDYLNSKWPGVGTSVVSKWVVSKSANLPYAGVTTEDWVAS
jgi:hypothetical protein